MALDDVRERASEAASDIKRRVTEGASAGERAAREQTRRVRRRAREVDAREAIGRGADAIATDASIDAPSSTKEEVARRAAAAAEAPAPVDATLAPVTRIDQVQHNARAGLGGAAEMASASTGVDAGEPAAMGQVSEMAMLGGGEPAESGGEGEPVGQTPADMATMGWDGDDGEWLDLGDAESDEAGWF